MVTLLSFYPIDDSSWRLAWSSDVDDATFFVYRDGVLFDETTLTEITLSISPGTSPVFEVLDDPDATPTPAYPSQLLLTWLTVAGADHYEIQQEISAVWTTVDNVPGGASAVFSWQSAPQPDGQTANFRVVPIGVNGNAGTPLTFSKLIVRVPDPPDVSYAYNAGTGVVTISAN